MPYVYEQITSVETIQKIKKTAHDEFDGFYLVKSRFKAVNKIAIRVKTLYSANHFTFHAKNKVVHES